MAATVWARFTTSGRAPAAIIKPGLEEAGPADKNVEIITPILGGSDGSVSPGFFYYSFSFSYGPDGAQFRNGSLPQASDSTAQANRT